MEVEKVLGVFKEIAEEESNLNIQKELNTLQSHIQSNSFPSAETLIQEIKKKNEGSAVNEYSFSKLKVLEQIGALDLFGKYLSEALDNTLNKDSYKVRDNLSKLVTLRNTKLQEIKTTIQHLKNLDFASYYDQIEDYELGLIIPREESELKKVQQYLEDWHFILRHVNELCDSDHEEPKVYSVSTNSIGVFVLGSYLTIRGILDIVERVVKIYERISKIKLLRKGLEEEGIKKTIEEVDKRVKEIVNEERKKIVDYLISQHKKNIKQGREPELRTAINKAVEEIIIMHEKGIIIEATPPKIEKPEIPWEAETEDNKKERDKQDKEYQDRLKHAKEVTGILSNVTKTIKELTSTGKEVLQIAQYLNSDKESEQKKETK